MSNNFARFFAAFMGLFWIYFGFIRNWDWLSTNIFNTILFQIIFWILFLVFCFFFSSWLLGDNLEDLDGNEKPNVNLRFKVIIISIAVTLLSAFFWYSVF